MRQQCHSILGQVQGIVYVDNASAEINVLLTEFQSIAYFICNDENLGLGKAQNQGILLAKEKGATHILLLDQDTVTSINFVTSLLGVYEKYCNARKIAVVAPVYYDRSSKCKLSEGIIFAGVRIKRIPVNEEYQSVSYCIASGSLLSVQALNDVGLMKEELFIDSLDLEWCLRAKSLGYDVVMTNKTHMSHSIGIEAKNRILAHSPFREYYICRNSIILLFLPYVPLGYKIRKMVMIPLRLIYSLCSGNLIYFVSGVKGIWSEFKFK